jgi:ribosomal protein L13
VCDWTAPEDSGLPASARHESAGVDETVSGMIPDANNGHQSMMRLVTDSKSREI